MIGNLSESEDIGILPVVTITVLVSVIGYHSYGIGLDFLFHVVFWYGLIVVAWVDYYTLMVVDLTVYLLGGWAILTHLVLGNPISDKIQGAVAGFLMYLLIYVAAKAFYKKEAFGFGDVMLMGAVGGFLGLVNGLLAGFMAFYLALIGVGIQKVFGKKLGLKQEVAFGPSICLAALVTSLYGNDIFVWYVKSFLF